jgi:dethiobiotin synthetase
MHKGIFITGTDTGVGKTIVAATLARLLTLKGIKTGVMKPVTSGCITNSDGHRISEDAELLKWAAGSTDSGELCAPYILKEPIAPAEAAAMEGVRIDFGTIRGAFKVLSEQNEFTIVEGAGGLMVPLAGGFLVSDLICQLDIPALVVARPNLGTVNHTLLTTFVAKQLGIDVKGTIIANYPENPGKAESSAPHLMDTLSGVPILGIFKEINTSSAQGIVEKLVEQLMDERTTSILLREIGIDED